MATVHPIAGKLLEYRAMTKLLSTYVETLPNLADKMGRIHTNYIQTGTATGRLSSRDPNLQNIPVRDEAGRKIRSAFVSPANKTLVTADYSQIELVVLAHLSKDENMCKAFRESIDIHKATAAMIFGTTPDSVTPDMRRVAKTINFGVIYGMSAFRLAKDLNISRTQAQDFMNAYFATYSGITQFMQDVILNAEEAQQILSLFKELEELPKQTDFVRFVTARRILVQIFSQYLLYASMPLKQTSPQWLEEARRVMHYPENFSQGLERMVQLSGRTKEHLCRSMRKYYGTSASEFINDLRLTYIANQLVNSDAHILDLCYDSGFSNLSWMYTLFKQKYGCSPAAFRKKFVCQQ